MKDLARSRGLFFEEFEVGDRATSPGRTITEADVGLFAGLSGDYNELHTSAEYAKDTMFGQRVAHGLLGLSVASGLAWRTGFLEGTADALTGIEWKFRGPILIGDTIHLEAEVVRKKGMRRLDGGFVVFSVVLRNQRDEVVQKGSWTVLVRSGEAEEDGGDA